MAFRNRGNSGATNFVTSFNGGRVNYGTKMATARRDRGTIELVLSKIHFR
jgi:hypothetical protein